MALSSHGDILELYAAIASTFVYTCINKREVEERREPDCLAKENWAIPIKIAQRTLTYSDVVSD